MSECHFTLTEKSSPKLSQRKCNYCDVIVNPFKKEYIYSFAYLVEKESFVMI